MNEHPQLNLNPLEAKKQRVGRASRIYRAFHSQDLFGVPVSLTFQGRNKISTDCGAFCSLAVRALIIVYIIYLGTKMSTHELDSYQSSEHETDFTQLGSIFARDLGFDMAIGFNRDLKQTDLTLDARIQIQTNLNSTIELRMRPCNRTVNSV